MRDFFNASAIENDKKHGKVSSMPTKQKLLIVLAVCLGAWSAGCTMSHRIAQFTDCNFPRYADMHSHAHTALATETIKVVSYNIALAQKIDAALKVLQETKELKNADILCLQEMDEAAVQKIAQTLGYNYVYYPSALHPHTNKNFGVAIVSRWPLKNDKKILLPHAHKDRFHKTQREAVGVTAVINDKEILIYSLHLGVIISPKDRKEQVATVLAAIPKDTRYTIVCGDFNTFSVIHTKAIQDAFMHDGFSLATNNLWTYKYWYLFNKKMALDHIFYKGLRLVRAGNTKDRSASDHLPLWAEFSLQ